MTGNNADTRIKTILTADSGDFEAGVQRATKALEGAEGKFRSSNKRTEQSFFSLGRAAQGLAVYFSVRSVVNYGQQILMLADQLKVLEERTGVSAQFFSALQPEIENAGGSLDSFGSSLNKMSINLAKAAAGNKSAASAFAAIGLSVDELKRLSPEQQFLKISTAISQLSTRGQQAAAATAIFGKGIVSLLPTLTKGGEALQSFVDEQVRLGLAMSADTVQYLDDLGDSINTLGIKALNFSGEGLVKFLKFLDQKLLTGIAENFILIGSAVGAIDKDVAAEAFKVAQERYTGTGDYAPKKKTASGSGGMSELLDADGVVKAEANAKKLSDALGKLQRQTSRDIYTSGMTDLEEKLKQVDFSVADLARSFDTKLTPAMQKQVDTIKDNVATFDELQKQEKAAEKLAMDLGGAFSDAFEDGVLGAEKFSDVLGSLGKQIEKVLFNQLVTSPLNEFLGGAAKGLFKGGGKGGSSAGIGSFFSSIYDALPSFSFATGVRNVPYDMDARIHKGETVLSAQESKSMMAGGEKITVNVVNNVGANVKTSTKQTDSGTDLMIMIDQAVAANVANKGSQTAQSLAARDQRALTRR